MKARFTLAEIESAWPSGIHDLFVAKGVRPEETAAPFDPSNIRFVQPCRYRWDAAGAWWSSSRKKDPAPGNARGHQCYVCTSTEILGRNP